MGMAVRETSEFPAGAETKKGLAMQFTELMKELGEALREDMWWEDNAICISLEDAHIFVEYVPDRDGLYLYAHLAEVPRKALAKFGPPLLKASLFGMETNGLAVFAYDKDAEQVVLWEMHQLSTMTFEEFQQKYIMFMVAADTWRKRLSEESELPVAGQVSFA